jgi:hypothetical protein
MDGVDLVSTAAEFGTPLYVVSRAAIDAKIAELERDFTDKYPNARAAYASKAFLCVAMCRIIDDAGLALDVVSGGELYTAIRAGFPPGRIEFHGNNKTREELTLALNYGTPLEKLAQIQLALARLKDIYLFEEGQKPAEEDLLMMIQFALIKARVEKLVGIARYTFAFLKLDRETEVLSKSEMKHLGWFQKVVDNIARMVP